MALSKEEELELQSLKAEGIAVPKQFEGLTPSEYAELQALKAEGISAPNEPQFIEDQHPSISWWERTKAKNFLNTPEAQMEYLKTIKPNLDFTVHEGRVFLKGKNEQNFKALDPSSFEFSDVTDVGTDVLKGITSSMGASLGGLAGTFVAPGPVGLGAGGVAGAGAGLAAGEKLKQLLGEKVFDIKNTGDNKQIAIDAILGAAGQAAAPLVSKIGQAAAPYAEGVLKYPRAALNKIGERIYRSSPMMQALDKEAIKLDPKFDKNLLPSKVLNKYKVKGSNEKIAEMSDDLLGRLLEERNAVLDKATNAGATVDVDAATSELKSYLNQALSGRNPYKKDAAEKVKEMIFSYEHLKPSPAKELPIFDSLGMQTGVKKIAEVKAPSPTELAQINSDFYKYFDNAFNQGNIGDLESALVRKLGSGTKEAIESSVENSLGKAGRDSLSGLNKEMSSILNVKNKLGTEGAKQGKRALTEIALMSMAANPVVGTAQQAGKLVGSDFGRSTFGRGIQDFAEAQIPNLDNPLTRGIWLEALLNSPQGK